MVAIYIIPDGCVGLKGTHAAIALMERTLGPADTSYCMNETHKILLFDVSGKETSEIKASAARFGIDVLVAGTGIDVVSGIEQL